MSAKEYQSMNFDKERYKVYTWKHWSMLHWCINPGLVINELILGQRIPKVSLVDKTQDKPLVERSYVPCPHCHSLHDSRTWAAPNATLFKNWFGLYCPNCQQIIPCLMNVFTFLILAISFPLWGGFKKRLKTKWLAQQPARYENLNLEQVSQKFKTQNWVKTGLTWGAFMFVFMSVLYPYFTGGKITAVSLGLGVVIWTLGGLLFGYFMKAYLNKKPTIKTK
ncbi:hypothetical protein [uncultured Mesonia sp.]|uniref:hypothetical protein n=1 Tax=uncultured Mesonia sp. TaxID=399731 RepID=UPI00374E6E4A